MISSSAAFVSVIGAALISATSAYHLPPLDPMPKGAQLARNFRSRHTSRPSSVGVSPRRRPFTPGAVVMSGKAPEASNGGIDAAPFQKATNRHKPSPMAGMPMGPAASAGPSGPDPTSVIVRYMYEGGHIGQGRLCRLRIAAGSVALRASDVVEVLREDGVDFDVFYACAYESRESAGGWLPLEPAPRDGNPWSVVGGPVDGSDFAFAIPASDDAACSRRIDIKLFRRPKAPPRTDSIQSLGDAVDAANASETGQPLVATEHSSDALHAISAAVPGGKISLNSGYFGIGILHPKTSQNVGTLWRSAYQLGASILYTIGGRYKANSSDTLNVPARIPLIELDDWNSFAEWAAPKAAVWVAVEMGGTPLAEFEHPRNAIYILGSEDHGVPKSVLRGCREVVSLESEQYGSYNVAVAGSIVMYDRLIKMRKAQEGKGVKK
ncbi:hypothetical protein ACHAWF_014698 [Thalassiosira exigua]